MPNHVTNIIKASAEVIAALRGPKEAVDFNALIPMPESLRNINSGGDDSLVELLFGKLSTTPAADDDLGRIKLTGIIRNLNQGGMAKWDAARFENFIAMLNNYRQHGFASWYDFARAKWGTKWNAYCVAISDEGKTAQFQTAWSAPHPVIEALIAKFPHICIEHLWADEDIGSNLGHRRYCHGVSEIPIPDRIDFALTVTGSDREYYRQSTTTGLWEYFEADTSHDE